MCTDPRYGVLSVLIAVSVLYGVFMAAGAGYTDMVRAGDPTGISLVICIVTFIAIATGTALSFSSPTSPTKDAVMSAVAGAGEMVVVLGLVGTVVGFIMVSSSIDVSEVGSVDQVPKVVASLLTGMGVAFYTTLVGALCGIWINVQVDVLRFWRASAEKC